MPSLPRTVKPVPGLPEYVWDERGRRYRSAATGRFVAWQQVRGELDSVVKAAAGDMRLVSESLQAGRISLAEWQTQMMKLTKITHSAAGMFSKGGWAQMSQAGWGRVGGIVKREYEFLRNFAKDIASGKQKLDGTFLRRAMLYGNQGRPTYYRFTNATMQDRGFDEERSRLNPADHCSECVDQDALGWQPIGRMVPIGRRICQSNCQCSVEYRNTVTDERALI